MRRIEEVVLDSSGHVTADGARWLIGLAEAPALLSPAPLAEAEAMRDCMLSTMRRTARARGGTPRLRLARGRPTARTHRSYESQRDEIWNRKWDFRGRPFDRITQDAIDHDPACAAMPLLGQWTPGDTAHEACWNTLTDDLKARQIMQATAAPGVSRHHWGTDFDFKELNAAPWAAGGTWADEAAWLRDNARFFGFIQSFETAPAPGEARHMPEPWHWSYWPAAQALVDFTLAHDADVETALIAQWRTEGTVATGATVPSRFTFALANWRSFVRNVTQAAPSF